MPRVFFLCYFNFISQKNSILNSILLLANLLKNKLLGGGEISFLHLNQCMPDTVCPLRGLRPNHSYNSTCVVILIIKQSNPDFWHHNWTQKRETAYFT